MNRMFIACVVLILAACSASDNTYTLYREWLDIQSQEVDNSKRIHVATFDAAYDATYNFANCRFAEELFNAKQPHKAHTGKRIRYWCEKGRFRE